MRSNKVKCYICGTEFEGGDSDQCPYCDWAYTDIEHLMEPDERDPENTMSVEEAKRQVSSGKNIWGDPLPEKQ